MRHSSLPPSTDRDLYMSWDQYHGLIEALALKIYESGYRFDMLLCLARGGLRVGDVLSRIFEMPMAILAASSYREAAGKQQGDLDIAEFVTTTGGPLRGRVLLVDDLVDSGTTLERVIKHLKLRFAEITELRTAVLWQKAVSRFTPDYCVQYLPTSPWIHQPFEEYDELRPQALVARLAVSGKPRV